MAISLKHAFTDPKADGGDATIVRPTNWNAEHTLTGTAGSVLGFDASNNASEVLVRPVLGNVLTRYVATTGSDVTGDGASGNPYATLSHAWFSLVGMGSNPGIDFNGWPVTTQLADGNYDLTGFGAAVDVGGGWVGGSTLTIKGNAANPSAVVLL